MKIIEVNKRVWSLEAIHYSVYYIHYTRKAKFQLQVSENKIIIPPPPPNPRSWTP